MKYVLISMVLAVTPVYGYDWQAEQDRRDYNYYQEQQLEVQRQQLYLERDEQYDRRNQQLQREHQEMWDRVHREEE